MVQGPPKNKLLAMVDHDGLVQQLVMFAPVGGFIRDNGAWNPVPLDVDDDEEDPIRDDCTPIDAHHSFVDVFDMMEKTNATLTRDDVQPPTILASVRHVRTEEGHNRFDEAIGEVIHPKARLSLVPDPSALRPGTAEEAKSVGIPPGYTNYLVNTTPGAVTVGRGTDSKGRNKYFYSSAYHQQQAAKKFSKISRLHDKIGALDAALAKDANTDDTAAAVLIARRMGMRPSSTKDTKAAAQAYGASTLLAKHVGVVNGQTGFTFVGKGGKNLHLETDDPQIAQAVAARLANDPAPDDHIFDTTPEKMVKYIREYTGPEFTTKDLRTYLATALALRAVEAQQPPPSSKQEFARLRREIGIEVAKTLGNTPAQALSAYINPAVFYRWLKEESWLPAA